MRKQIWLVGLGVLLATQSAVAHHSFAPFDLGRSITLKVAEKYHQEQYDIVAA